MGGERGDLVHRVAREIAARRRELHLTQEAFAAVLRIATKNVQRIEAGQQNLSLETLQRIANALDTTPERLLAASTAAKRQRLPRVLARLARAGHDVRSAMDRGRRARDAVPVMTLRAAAGRPPGTTRVVDVLGWVRLADVPGPATSHFVAEVEGRSMEPRVHAGSLCLFGPVGPPPYRGRTVLVTFGGLVDDASGASFALKRLKSVRRLRDGRTRVELESINPDVPPIVVETHEDDELRVVAELVRVIVAGG